ncbi:COG1470 family protein [Streptomyces sp. 6N223]|uniref:COG1470 family protein n=1 Tax=Streptomyces sp. 6N223 TaxID=3457412 RepID=UPI003FD369F5
MTVSASLAESSVTVEPGAEERVAVHVLNSGDTVEEVTFEVVGACAAWATVEPGSLSLYPGRSGAAMLTLRPPRGAEVPAGETPFGVRVVPTSEASETVVPEGTVTVTPFTEVTGELVPRGSHSSWRGRHKVAVDNTGNVPAKVTLTGQQGTERARLAFEPAELEIPPGQAKFGQLTVRPANRVWRGSPITHPFQAVVTPQVAEGETAPAPVVLDGAYEQQPILPSWLPRALLAAAVVAILLVGLWYSVLRPTVESAAREAITPEAIQDAQDTEGSSDGGSEGGQSVGGGSGGADAGGADGGIDSGVTGGTGGTEEEPGGGGPGGTGGSDGAGTGGPDGGETVTGPTSDRRQIQDAVGGEREEDVVMTVPEGSTFELTDVLVQNPQGDAGSLVISSGGEPLWSMALENFRDWDQHFVSGIAVPAGGEITVSLDCREVGTPVGAPELSECSEAVFVSGVLTAN